MLFTLETHLAGIGKALLFCFVLNACICYVRAQKYWSCDQDCPLKCSAGDDNLDKPLCCYIPDVTVLAITFASQCHFDCANKCYSKGLKVHNEGDCTGYKSSESVSEEFSGSLEDDDTPDTENQTGDLFDQASTVDLHNLTSAEIIETLEKQAMKNDPNEIKGRKANKGHHHHKKTTTELPEEDDEDEPAIKEIADNSITDTTEETPTNQQTPKGGEDVTNEPSFQEIQPTDNLLKEQYLKDSFPSTTIINEPPDSEMEQGTVENVYEEETPGDDDNTTPSS